MIVDRHRRVRPPEEGLGHGGPVVELSAYLDIGLSRIKGECRDSLGPIHLIHIVYQQGFAAVLIFLQLIIGRHKGGRPVVLGPVELDAAGDPGAGQAHQGRLDHVIVIHKIIVVGLVIGPLDPSAQLRQDHHLQIFVLQKDCLVLLILFLMADLLRRRIGIDLSAASLIDSFFQEHGILIRFPRLVGGNRHPFLPDSDLVHVHASFLHVKFIYYFCFIISA